MSSREEKREDLLKHPEQFRDAVREMGRFFFKRSQGGYAIIKVLRRDKDASLRGDRRHLV